MTQNRKLTISIGNSRKDTFWKRQELTFSDLCNRLEVLTRSTETLAEYMRMSKPQVYKYLSVLFLSRVTFPPCWPFARPAGQLWLVKFPHCFPACPLHAVGIPRSVKPSAGHSEHVIPAALGQLLALRCAFFPTQHPAMLPLKRYRFFPCGEALKIRHAIPFLPGISRPGTAYFS